MDIKKELMKFYVWQRNNCNKVEELKDIEEMVDIYMTKREVNKTNGIHDVSKRQHQKTYDWGYQDGYSDCANGLPKRDDLGVYDD